MNITKRIGIMSILSVLFIIGCETGEFFEQDYTSVQTLDLRDDDKDGVINARDLCAQTPLTSQIDIWGCSEWNIDYKNEDFIFTFGFDKDAVLPEHQASIQKILSLTLKNDNARILLVGDTSAEGSDKYNEGLGKRRADALIHELVANGFPRDRIVGFVWNQDAMIGILKKRERRTIVRVVYRMEESVNKWNIYTTEEARKETL